MTARSRKAQLRTVGTTLIGALVAGLIAAGLVPNLFAAPTQGALVADLLTTPTRGVVLHDTTGAVHYWYGDHLNGLCDIVPSPGTVVHATPPSVCAQADVPGAAGASELAIDTVNHFIYFGDASRQSQGVTRVSYNPATASLISGSGVLIGQSCGLGGNQPLSVALGPDGNLYVGLRRSPNIIRIVGPQAGGPVCQTVGLSSSRRLTSSVTFVGNDLYMADTNGLSVIRNATACNNNCQATSLLTDAVPDILAVDSDQEGNLYAVNTTDAVQIAASTLAPTTLSTGIISPTSITVDRAGVSPHPVYFTDDGDLVGGTPLKALLYNVGGVAGAPQVAPDAPTNVTATAGDGQATVSWTAPSGTVTRYTVTTHLAGSTAPAPGIQPVNITSPDPNTPPPTQAGVAGLTNGTGYQFTVTATNQFGTSPESAPSASVTPAPAAPIAVPGAPTGVSAVSGAEQATVSWTAPINDGGSPITSYTVTVNAPAGAAQPVVPPVAAPKTSVVVNGLTGGASYSFTVAATNKAGTGPSATSNTVVPQAASADLQAFVSGPSEATVGSTFNDTMTVFNAGPNTARAATVSGSVTGPGAVGTLPGCTSTATSFSCPIGDVASGGTATVTVPVSANAATTPIKLDAQVSSATTDPNTANNGGSVTTTVTVPATDLQISGSAGQATRGQPFNLNLQVRNSGKVGSAASTVSIALPAGFTWGGSPTPACAQTSASTVTCQIGPLAAGGQTNLIVGLIAPNQVIKTTISTTVSYAADTNQTNNTASISVDVR